MFTTRYVDKWTITGWKKEPLKLFGYSDVFNAHYILNHEGVMKWGRWFVLEANMVEVTPELLDQYPSCANRMDFSTDTVPPIAGVLAAIYFYNDSWAS